MLASEPIVLDISPDEVGAESRGKSTKKSGRKSGIRASFDGRLWLDLVSKPSVPPPTFRPDFRPFFRPLYRTQQSGSLSTLDSFVDELPIEAGLPTLPLDVKAKPLTDDVAEKGLAWQGYEDDPLPNKVQGRVMRNLRHQILYIYRRLFGVVFIINMAIFIELLARGEANAQKLGTIVVANLFTAILMRQEYVVNCFFAVFCSVPLSWPLWIRRICARVYHIGGIHSGSAVSGTIWLFLFVIQATREVVEKQKTSVPTLVMSYLILFLLVGMIVFAYPRFRHVRHDTFERIHRFCGWTAAAMVWAQVILLTNDYKTSGESLGTALKKSAAFWLVVVLTASLILPWLRLRKVPVRAEVLSKHALRLHMDYGVNPVAGSFQRISLDPLMEWHSFATVAEPGKTGYSLVISRAGDWTSRQIDNPPKAVWVRGLPTCGVVHVVPMFRRVLLVATGSGIAPLIPCILQQLRPMRLLWTSPDVRETFGENLVNAILTACPDTVLYDTRKYGKPNMVKLTYRMVRDFDAEAVVIISNEKLTEKVVYGMMSRGIPAFGAIWDS